MHQPDPTPLPQAAARSAAGTLGRYGALAFDFDVKALLAPLIRRLETYDTARLQLEQQGGTLDDLVKITAMLKAKIRIPGRYTRHTVSLTEQASLHAVLGEIGHGDVLLDVRQRHTHMPVYYLCRVRQDYWHEYSLVVEDLYLCLSGDLCELRSAITHTMLRFFTQVYPQPVIHALLLRLQQLDGSALNALPQKALPLYVRLSQAFNRFLEVDIPWGHRQLQVPLTKLLWGNVSRLELVGSTLKNHAVVREAAARLAAVAQEVIERVLHNGEMWEGAGE